MPLMHSAIQTAVVTMTSFKVAYMCIPNIIEEDGWYHHNNASNTEVHCGIGMGKPLEYSTAGIIK